MKIKELASKISTVDENMIAMFPAELKKLDKLSAEFEKLADKHKQDKPKKSTIDGIVKQLNKARSSLALFKTAK